MNEMIYDLKSRFINYFLPALIGLILFNIIIIILLPSPYVISDDYNISRLHKFHRDFENKLSYAYIAYIVTIPLLFVFSLISSLIFTKLETKYLKCSKLNIFLIRILIYFVLSPLFIYLNSPFAEWFLIITGFRGFG